jgi:hypothetical protein
VKQLQQFAGKCNNCGKQGHKEAQCWENEENKDKYYPKGNKMSEAAQSVIGQGTSGTKVEFLLCTMTFPGDQKMLTDPNVWIADTAVMVHTTPYATGMHKIKEATANDAITVGKGINEKALCVAKVAQE